MCGRPVDTCPLVVAGRRRHDPVGDLVGTPLVEEVSQRGDRGSTMPSGPDGRRPPSAPRGWLPALLVAAHMLGACVVWVGTLNVLWKLRERAAATPAPRQANVAEPAAPR